VTLSLDQVRHVAALARLSLTPEEERQYHAQLTVILDAMEQLRALETTDVAPTSHASLYAGARRPDEPTPCLSPEQALQNAPARHGTSFAVPKVLD
jgi:aspartyl-tRNA(Asn)/glutamyl-tRNA(Gln) amidotransferase subunit C